MSPEFAIRHDWTRDEVAALFAKPFADLLFQAQSVHRRYHDPNTVQLSTLVSIKTGGCPEDCGYCSQSVKFETGVSAGKLMEVAAVVADAQRAKAAGATRYCMGAAWRSPNARDLEKVCRMVEGVKSLGLETCVTLGMLEAAQAEKLQAAGLDFYNHNIDTSPEYYTQVVTTRNYQDRLDTLDCVRQAGIKVCCGGIVGMGEGEGDRVGMLQTLATLPVHPESVPINKLQAVAGTPLGEVSPIDALDFVRTVAVARVLMPRSVVRLSAGRETMSEEAQALCYLAGANSIFFGPRLLTTGNPAATDDARLFARLGISALGDRAPVGEPAAIVAE